MPHCSLTKTRDAQAGRLLATSAARAREIVLYLRDDAGLAIAKRWAARLRDKASSIGDAPDAFALDPELGPGRRRLVVGPYLIVYEAQDTRVLIVGVVHGARDLRRVFAESDEA